MRAYDAIKQAQKQRGEPTWFEENEARRQKELADLRAPKRSKSFRSSGLYGSEDPNSRVQAKRWRSGTLGYGESKDHAMKLDKNTLAQMIKEVLGLDLNEVTAGEEVDWLKMLGNELQQLSDKPLPKGMENRIINAYDLKDLYDKIKDLKEPEYESETDKGWSTERLTSPDVPDSRGPGPKGSAGVSKKSHVSKVPRRAVPRQNTRLAGVNELKFTKQQLQQMIKEELEVILTDEEAVEMFGLENLTQEGASAVPDSASLEKLEEEETNEGCGDDAHKRDDEEDNELSPDVKQGINESKNPKPRMKENNLFMTRDKLAEMIRQEMTRTIRRNKENA